LRLVQRAGTLLSDPVMDTGRPLDHRRHVDAASGGARLLASNLVDAEELEDCGCAARAARNEERGAPVGQRRPRGGLADDC
jgi:hypothetical protein